MDTLEQLRDRIEFLERKMALSTENTFKASPFEYEREAPLVTNLTNVARAAVSGSTPVALTWAVPDDTRIEAFEIWSKNLSDEAPQWVFKGAVTQPPWGDNIVSDSDKIVSFAVRTKLRNGLGTTIDNSPTIPISITAPSTSITDPSQVGPNVIGDSAFVRTGGDAISIGTADIQNASITNAKIVTLEAGKITAGSISSSVAILGTVLAGQILAGTISVAITMTSPTIISTSGANVCQLSGGRLDVTSTGGNFTSVEAGQITVSPGAGSGDVNVQTNAIYVHNTSNNTALTLEGITNGNVVVRNSSGSARITLDGSTGNGTFVGNVQGVNITATGNVQGVDINATGVYKVDSVTVINAAGAFVGAGVDVGSNGVGCGGVNISGGFTGQTVTFNAFPTQMVFKGGVLTGYTL